MAAHACVFLDPVRAAHRDIDEQAARLKALDTAVRREEPDAVHQMRVTTRRLRAGLQAFPMVAPKTATMRLQTFRTPDFGVLGHADGDAVAFYRRPIRLPGRPIAPRS